MFLTILMGIHARLIACRSVLPELLTLGQWIGLRAAWPQLSWTTWGNVL